MNISLKMNNQIINNLFQFWTKIGEITNTLNEYKSYSTVSMKDSDWPNRIYNVQNNDAIINEILSLCKEDKLPEIITLSKPNELVNRAEFEFYFAQRNMSLDLNTIPNDELYIPNIIRVKSVLQCIEFANTASKSFGYKVDYKVILEISKATGSTQLFIYQEDENTLGCGIVFFDSNNNAGLHMIGTLPQGRGKGIGKQMTQKLINIAKQEKKEQCVLHASLMGENIYKRLGFIPYGEIETFKILDK